MGFRHDLLNGFISLGIGVVVTGLSASDEEYDTSELLIAVAIASFLSGFFTSYFAK